MVRKRRRLKTRCSKCKKRITGKICYCHKRKLCRMCMTNMKYEKGARGPYRRKK
jgi:hypothetical protein